MTVNSCRIDQHVRHRSGRQDHGAFMGQRDEHGGEFVQGLARGLDVIRAFNGERPRMTLTEVAEVSGLSRATARRSLLTLRTLGYVRSDGRLFSLTPSILSLGYSFLSSQGIGERVNPILKQTSDALTEPCALGMLDGTDMVCVAHSPGEQRVLTIGLTAGSRMPLLTTAIGRVLLAMLDETQRETLLATAPLDHRTPRTVTDRDRLRDLLADIRTEGHAIVDEEFELGVRSIAVPVMSNHGEPLGALNVIASAGRVDLQKMREEYLPVLNRAAEAIALAMI